MTTGSEEQIEQDNLEQDERREHVPRCVVQPEERTDAENLDQVERSEARLAALNRGRFDKRAHLVEGLRPRCKHCGQIVHNPVEPGEFVDLGHSCDACTALRLEQDARARKAQCPGCKMLYSPETGHTCQDFIDLEIALRPGEAQRRAQQAAAGEAFADKTLTALERMRRAGMRIELDPEARKNLETKAAIDGPPRVTHLPSEHEQRRSALDHALAEPPTNGPSDRAMARVWDRALNDARSQRPPTGEELSLFGALAHLPAGSHNIARTIETLARTGLWPAVAAVASLLDSEDGRGKGDQRWRALSGEDLLYKLRSHLRAVYLVDRDADSGRPPMVHVASRALMLVTMAERLGGSPPRTRMLEREPVIIESPLAGCEPLHLAYLDACTRDSLARGETPYASHRQLSRALDDTIPEERELGLSAGLVMRDAFSFMGWHSVFYQDLGMSGGMQRALDSQPKGSFAIGRQVSAAEWPRILAEAAQDRFFGHSLAIAHRATPALEGAELALAARQVFQRECLEAWTLEHREGFARERPPPQTERSSHYAPAPEGMSVGLDLAASGGPEPQSYAHALDALLLPVDTAPAACTRCDGTGVDPDEDPDALVDCRACEGTGKL